MRQFQMAIDYSIGFTEEEVLGILAIQKEELKKTLQSFSDSGSSATKRRLDEINSIISSCQQALQKMNPKKYGKASRLRYADLSGGFPK
ncbi:MAG: hypothetical protein J6P03_02310 [Opitutales bacterium]|nr:hypothetical protein [Opitutales bacterium]